jgi:DNA helicase-2/ATP-dependent DNA helicase PcrA
LQQNAVQLAVYRLAWAATAGVSPDSVRGAFHYVRSGRTVIPASLLGAIELAKILEAA